VNYSFKDKLFKPYSVRQRIVKDRSLQALSAFCLFPLTQQVRPCMSKGGKNLCQQYSTNSSQEVWCYLPSNTHTLKLPPQEERHHSSNKWYI